MHWLNWLQGATLAWYTSKDGRSLKLTCIVERNGGRTRVPFKVDTGAAETLVPLYLVDDLVPEEEYQRLKRESGLKNLRGAQLEGAQFHDMKIGFSVEPPFEGLMPVPGGLWVSEQAQCGLLGMSFLREYGLLVLNFPQVVGPNYPGTHFGLIKQPTHSIELQESPGSGAPGPER